jgi:hypothetical protein
MANPIFTMPMRTECSAPIFDSNEPRTLVRYFEDLNMLLACANVANIDQRLRYSRNNVLISVANLWEVLPEADGQHTWEQYKAAVIALYPEIESGKRFSNTDLDRIVVSWSQRGIRTLGKWAEFYCKFLQISRYLLNQHKLLTNEQN